MPIRLDGDIHKLTKKLKNLSNVNWTGINASIGEALRTSTRDRFKTEESPEKKKWKKSIRASKEGGQTLTSSSRLKNSIRSKETEKGVAVGTNTIYASTHQLGADRTIRRGKKRTRINIPERPYLGLSQEDMREIQGTLEDAISNT